MEKNGAPLPSNNLRLKMERFYDDEDEEKEPYSDPYFEEEETAEVVGYIDEKGILDVIKLDITQSKINQKLLISAIKIVKNNWLWFFKTTDKKVEEIKKTYLVFNEIVNDFESLAKAINNKKE